MTVATSTKANGGPAAPSIQAVRDRARLVPISVEQYHQMIEDGIVPEDSTVELLRGLLVRKDRGTLGEDSMGHSPLHTAVIAMLTKLVARMDNEAYHLQFQLPVSCAPDGEPEPDGSIVRGSPRDYLDRIPTAADVSCVVEVAHSSLERDRQDKLPIYAGAGIAQYVIINLQNKTIEVYTDPDSQAELYRTKVTLDANQTLQLRLPVGEFAVSAKEILP